MFHDVSSNTRPSVVAVRTVALVGIVLHTSDGVNSLAWLQGSSALSGSPASADFLISRNGDTYRIAKRGYYSYHAGQSRWGEWSNREVNERFIGIELENADSLGQMPTPEQYQTLGALITQLVKDGELPIGYIVTTHAAIALPRGRKSDPAWFDFAWIVWPS